MNLREFLDSEVTLASLGALARQGFGWWIDELSSMLPPSWRAGLSSRPRILAGRASPGVWRYWKDGRPLGGPPPEVRGRSGRRARQGVGLLLAPGAVLTRELPTPRMPVKDVRRMLELDMDRLSPLAPDLVHHDMEVLERDAGGGRQRVLLGVTPRASAAELLAAARAEGLRPAAMGLRIAEDDPALRFDFLPAAMEAAGETVDRRAGRYAWAAVGGLLLLNLVVLVGRDMVGVAHAREQVAAVAPRADAVLNLRRRVQAEETRRRDLIARGHRTDPLWMLNAATEAVPLGAWVQHLEWNGQVLRLVGFRRSDVDMAAALRGSGVFANPRMVGAPAQGDMAASATTIPFDITADARPRPWP